MPDITGVAPIYVYSAYRHLVGHMHALPLPAPMLSVLSGTSDYADGPELCRRLFIGAVRATR
jgi:hypothetical protein